VIPNLAARLDISESPAEPNGNQEGEDLAPHAEREETTPTADIQRDPVKRTTPPSASDPTRHIILENLASMEKKTLRELVAAGIASQ
jgi:hypothetical protein